MYATGTGVSRNLSQAGWRERRECRLGHQAACRDD
jgi:hypothetical protein